MKNNEKNYQKWMGVKADINNNGKVRNFNEGDVVWVAVGENVGVEIDGKGEKYSRPVVVLRKYNRKCFAGVPLTSKPHSGSWYVEFEFQGKKQMAVLVQTRLIDAARIYNRMGRLSKKDYALIENSYLALIQNKNMP